MKLIVAVDEDYGIGKNNGLLLYNKVDMDFFKETTMGHTVIMGKNTFFSMKKPLKGRRNIVLTKGEINNSDIEVCHDYTELIGLSDAFVIGGAQIYKLFLPYCDELYITENKGIYDADTFFPEFNKEQFHEEILITGETFVIKKYTRK